MRELIHMPRMFDEPYYPGGFPLNPQTDNWGGPVKNDLVQAIKRYYNFFTGDYPVPTKKEEQLLIEFLIYYIHAPIWAMNPNEDGTNGRLRKLADQMKTLQNVHDFLDECLEIGLDPF